MKAEARIAAGADVSVIASGGRKETLESALDDVFEAHVGAVLSFGISGGLAPGLRPGTVLIARSIVAEDGEQFECDRAWSQRLAAALGGAPIVDMAGIDRPVTTPADKRALHLSTRAAVADMESHIAARFAAARNLPFAAFRVVADPAERHVPPAALAGISPTGAVAAGPVLRALARAPGQIPHLVKTAFDANAAFVSLFRSRQMTSVGGFGFFDFSELVLDVPREDVIGGSLPV
jgi:adenosylhomocysteine nucleosidase